MEINSVTFSKLLLDTKDGDWGKSEACQGFLPYRVIRGTDFADTNSGNLSNIPIRYLAESSAQRRTLQPDDIIIETAGGSNDRPTGRTLLVKRKLIEDSDLPLTCASFCRFLRVNPKLAAPRYIYWYLQYLYAKGEMWIHQVKHTGIARFQYTRFASTVQVPLPSAFEQQAIAHILGSLDDKIELNRQMNETLESIARTLFNSWFVDFDPVRAKMEGRQPYGMDAETAALFPDGFEDSMLGEIPRGWKVTTIGEVTHIVGGSTPSTKEAAYWDNGTIHWATPKDLSSLANAVLIETERCITETGLQQISSRLLPKGTVLLSSRAPIGYLAIAEIPVAINQGFIALICDKELSNHYILQWLRLNMDIIKGRANGTTFQEISKANFRPIPLVVPCNPILKFFDQQVSNIHEQIVNNLQQNQTLATLRDILLPKLLSGEIRVKDAEKEVETPCGQYFSIKAFQE